MAKQICHKAISQRNEKWFILLNMRDTVVWRAIIYFCVLLHHFAVSLCRLGVLCFLYVSVQRNDTYNGTPWYWIFVMFLLYLKHCDKISFLIYNIVKSYKNCIKYELSRIVDVWLLWSHGKQVWYIFETKEKMQFISKFLNTPYINFLTEMQTLRQTS
jgi:hypothetical protein